jgi:ATP-binding cassette subfamily B protein
MCNDEISRDDVVNALIKSGIYEKIRELPNGIDNILTREFDDDGAILSGGEAQKIAIARMLVRKNQFAILDEPTSALDPIAEFRMYENMMEATKNKTVIFISHRLSSAVIADRVYMLEHGEICESGTHGELMNKAGKYAAMFKLQSEKYND